MKPEMRFAEVRMVEGNDGSPTIEGYSIRFDSLSVDLGGFREVVSSAATIGYHDVRAFWNHDHNFVLGRQSAQTLELTRDDKGIFMRVRPPKVGWVSDLVESMRRGDVKEQSFAFHVMPGGSQWSEGPDGALTRTLNNITLVDVSVVAVPAYEQTSASVRSAAEILRERPLPAPNLDIVAKQAELLAMLKRGFWPHGGKA